MALQKQTVNPESTLERCKFDETATEMFSCRRKHMQSQDILLNMGEPG